MLRKLMLFVGLVIFCLQFNIALAVADEKSPTLPLMTIGSGTTASCQTDAARNLLSLPTHIEKVK